jgi:hypothetical protein
LVAKAASRSCATSRASTVFATGLIVSEQVYLDRDEALEAAGLRE